MWACWQAGWHSSNSLVIDWGAWAQVAQGYIPGPERQSLSHNQKGLSIESQTGRSTAGWRWQNVSLCSICRHAGMPCWFIDDIVKRKYTYSILNLLCALAGGRKGWLAEMLKWAAGLTYRKENVKSEVKNLIAADSSWGGLGEFQATFLPRSKFTHPNWTAWDLRMWLRQTSFLGAASCFGAAKLKSSLNPDNLSTCKTLTKVHFYKMLHKDFPHYLYLLMVKTLTMDLLPLCKVRRCNNWTKKEDSKEGERLKSRLHHFQIRPVATEECKGVVLGKWMDRECQLEKHWREGDITLS